MLLLINIFKYINEVLKTVVFFARFINESFKPVHGVLSSFEVICAYNQP